MNYKLFLIIFIPLFLSCKSELVELKIGDKTILVEVADSDDERTLGLMMRESLEENRGMIFVFDEEKQVSFWMKNTGIPLSIAYIGKDGTIYEIYDLKPYSLEPVPSKRSSIKYALEVNRGYFKDNGIMAGAKVDLENLKDYLNSSK